MAWQAIADETLIGVGVQVRVGYTAVCFGTQTDAERFNAFRDSALSPTRFDDFAIMPSIEGTARREISAGSLRADVQQVFDALRATWGTACLYAYPTDVAVRSVGVLPEVDTQTTISLASIAILALIAFLFFREFKKGLL